MAKKIVIENQRGVAPEFNLWTMEAVEEMLELFPEFKDKFAVEARGNYRPQGSEIDRDAFENIPDDEKDLYVRLSSGKYLVPYASTDWYIERAKQLSGNNGFDSEKLVKLRADANDGENPLSITLTVDAFAPTCTGYGVQNLGLGISVKDFDESQKDLFKNIVKHELGHVFPSCPTATAPELLKWPLFHETFPLHLPTRILPPTYMGSPPSHSHHILLPSFFWPKSHYALYV